MKSLIAIAIAGMLVCGTAEAQVYGTDAYSNGVWTPTDASGASLTLTVAGTPTWFRVGNLVFASYYIAYPTTVDASTALLGGLPFPVANNSTWNQGILSFTDDTLLLFAPTISNTSTFQPRGSANVTLTNAQLSGKQVAGTLIYSVQ